MIKSAFAVVALFFAVEASASVSVVSNDGSTSPSVAVSSACIVNSTEFTVGLDSRWVEDGAWQRNWLRPGDSLLLRLVLDAPSENFGLEMRFPKAPADHSPVIQEIETLAGDVREDDCSKVTRYDFIQREADGDFALEPKAQD